jgi:hypothetical protein
MGADKVFPAIANKVVDVVMAHCDAVVKLADAALESALACTSTLAEAVETALVSSAVGVVLPFVVSSLCVLASTVPTLLTTLSVQPDAVPLSALLRRVSTFCERMIDAGLGRDAVVTTMVQGTETVVLECAHEYSNNMDTEEVRRVLTAMSAVPPSCVPVCVFVYGVCCVCVLVCRCTVSQLHGCVCAARRYSWRHGVHHHL